MMIGSLLRTEDLRGSSATLGFSVMMSATIRGRPVGPYFNPLSILCAFGVVHAAHPKLPTHPVHHIQDNQG